MQMMFVGSLESNRPIRYVAPIDGRWLPVHSGASGLAILAHRSEADIESIISRGLTAITGNTIIDAEAAAHSSPHP